MTVHFTSDLHLGHRKAAEHRGFSDVTLHDYAIQRRWADVVRDDDAVWVLGDLAASSPAHALGILRELPGTKHLVLGNHDQPHPMHRDAHLRLGKYLDVFASVSTAARRRVNGTEVLLSHFPYHRDRGEVRHTQWRLRDEGRWLLHGHTHGPERVTLSNRRQLWTAPERPGEPGHVTNLVTREIHVGVDAWDLTPVSLDTIAQLIKENS
jgi:calcineurin-like phosphoesterase family protein